MNERNAYKAAWRRADYKKNPTRYYQYEVSHRTKLYEAGLCVRCGKRPATTTSGDGGNGGKRIKFCQPCRIVYNNRKNQARVLLKQTVLSHYGPKGVCRCSWPFCGTTDMDMLSIDHIDNSGGHERRTTSYAGGMSFYAKLKRSGYPPGFQTLCHNHQWKKEILRRREQSNTNPDTAIIDLGTTKSA
jgi:hypothetical protein